MLFQFYHERPIIPNERNTMRSLRAFTDSETYHYLQVHDQIEMGLVVEYFPQSNYVWMIHSEDTIKAKNNQLYDCAKSR